MARNLLTNRSLATLKNGAAWLLVLMRDINIPSLGALCPELAALVAAEVLSPLPRALGMPMLARLVTARVPPVMTVAPIGCSAGSLLKREPVTMIAAPSSTVSAAVGGDASCAKAGAVRPVANKRIAVFEYFILSPGYFGSPLSLVYHRTLCRHLLQCNCI